MKKIQYLREGFHGGSDRRVQSGCADGKTEGICRLQGLEIAGEYCDAGKSGKMTDLQKKDFLRDFLESIEVYPQR